MPSEVLFLDYKTRAPAIKTAPITPPVGRRAGRAAPVLAAVVTSACVLSAVGVAAELPGVTVPESAAEVAAASASPVAVHSTAMP